MGRMFRFEMRKLFQHASFYICGAIMLAVSWLTGMTGMLSVPKVQLPSSFGNEMLLSSIGRSQFDLVLAILVAMLVCEDFTSGTIKNIVARGYSALEIILAKYFTIAIGTGIVSVLLILEGIVFNKTVGHADMEIDGKLVLMLLVYILIVQAYTSLFFMVSILFKKTGGAIAINIVGSILLSLLFVLINHLTNVDLSVYWIDHAESLLSSVSASTEDIVKAFVLALVYLVVGVIVSIVVMRKSEV